MTKQQILEALTFGARIAEDETDALRSYFVETDQWRRIFAGDVDVVYGPKGSGKSAIYAILAGSRTELFDRSILLTTAENPRGAPAFRDLVADPPASEAEFTSLWKLYFLSLTAGIFKEYGIDSKKANLVVKTLSDAKLLPEENNLRKLIRAALDYVRALMKIESVEGGMEIDPATGMLKGFTSKITLREHASVGGESQLLSLETLFGVANEALRESGYYLWIILDRLDVAFAENVELEQNALRALFKVYIDMFAHERIKPKIFLRTDIWRRITKAGFREASHVTRHVTISWSAESLMNLVVRRALKNPALLEFYRISEADVLADYKKQIEIFYRLFPLKVDPGEKKPEAFDWILSRTRDGLGENAPRELIHLVSASRDGQLRKLETGGEVPDSEMLFSTFALKEALGEVSKVRFEQTLLAEYPLQSASLEKLRGEKTLQIAETLARLWNVSAEEALLKAYELRDIGFFEQRGTKESPEFWVPFLYRDALNMVQGTAE
jgi:hypothetical protein